MLKFYFHFSFLIKMSDSSITVLEDEVDKAMPMVIVANNQHATGPQRKSIVLLNLAQWREIV